MSPKVNSPVESHLAPLLRYFVGIELTVELKQGRTFRGHLREADAYMNLVLSRASKQPNYNLIGEVTTEQFELVHIRGPSIRYIIFGAKLDICDIIKSGRDRERAAIDKYKRGTRKAK